MADREVVEKLVADWREREELLGKLKALKAKGGAFRLRIGIELDGGLIAATPITEAIESAYFSPSDKLGAINAAETEIEMQIVSIRQALAAEADGTSVA